MNTKIIILFLIILGIIYFHFSNKHKIMRYAKQIDGLQLQLTSEKELNLHRLIENNKLSCKERIEKLAAKELDMYYPQKPDAAYTIVLDDENKSVRLIDYIVPPAEALNN